jgi:hypothetical protein
METVERLSLVYNANGGVLGELAYVLGKARGTADCALCSVTHGAIREKRAWRDLRESLPVPVAAYHLNERPAELAALTEGQTPCAVAHTNGDLAVVLGPAELAACGGGVEAFREALDAGLAQAGLAWP